jgi:hypothetical protein
MKLQELLKEQHELPIQTRAPDRTAHPATSRDVIEPKSGVP